MPRVFVDVDEAATVYFLVPAKPDGDEEDPIDGDDINLSDAEIARIAAVQRDWDAVQERLLDLFNRIDKRWKAKYCQGG